MKLFPENFFLKRRRCIKKKKKNCVPIYPCRKIAFTTTMTITENILDVGKETENSIICIFFASIREVVKDQWNIHRKYSNHLFYVYFKYLWFVLNFKSRQILIVFQYDGSTKHKTLLYSDNSYHPYSNLYFYLFFLSYNC